MSKYGVFAGPYFPAFGLNTERYGVSLRIQSKCGKMRTGITPNTDTFYALCMSHLLFIEKQPCNFEICLHIVTLDISVCCLNNNYFLF